MHKSRLAGFIFDCQTDDLNQAAEFWRQALGYAGLKADGDNYLQIIDGPDTLLIEAQKVDHESRVHIDIETDDMDAEVERLERLGATRVAQIESWWVMQAPSGQRFCVVNAQRADFNQRANVWGT